ncbi:YggT family protein [Macrococcus brunensis]|uniref:YggT family protein n=1 Tax=Macrococcus brunensis TaxID=198483 RepID=A0A4R6BG33_9STAP|nr:YggT family protein [Macrococcus brunensis]TDL98768.1 YggT family protein [Macrococcus brunensis]ULG72804.1 YggT family protein [Macrococcus brunensis]
MSLAVIDMIFNGILVLLNIYFYAIIIYIFMSWIPGLRESFIGEWIARFVEPYLEIFRKIIPPLGMFDFSPIVAIFVLQMFVRGLIAIYNQFIVPMLM